MDENDLPTVMRLIDAELSEPYSIFTYRYFLRQWPQLSFLAIDAGGAAFGTIICKAEPRGEYIRGYVAMLVVEKAKRARGVGARRAQRRLPPAPSLLLAPSPCSQPVTPSTER